MKLTAEQLLSQGYFFKELPPPFTSDLFGKKYKGFKKRITKSALKKLPRSSESIPYSIPKNGPSRRTLKLPNPFHYQLLCQTIADNWSKIEKIYEASIYSTSRPMLDGVRISSHGTKRFDRFKRNRLMISGENAFELKTDISKYYSTIYTHIIPWVIYGRPKAKANRNPELWGNSLDRDVRNLQSGQTNGIPIGPQASAVIAELIGCKIDKLLQSTYGKIKGFRYVDDYYFYFPQEAAGEKVIKALQVILAGYQLELNERKTRVMKFPFGLEAEWVIALRAFILRDFGKKQENDIRDYFSMVFRFASQFPEDPVLSYAIRKIEGKAIDPSNWDYFETWMAKAILHNPLILPEATRIFLRNSSMLSKTKLKATIQAILRIHIPKRNSYEIAWALWLAKSLSIKIDASFIKSIFSSGDVVSILIALDLKDSGLILGRVDTRKLSVELTEDSLFDERWLLTYESISKKWLKPRGSNPINTNPYFKILESEKISFYDASKQMDLVLKPFNGGKGVGIEDIGYL